MSSNLKLLLKNISEVIIFLNIKITFGCTFVIESEMLYLLLKSCIHSEVPVPLVWNHHRILHDIQMTDTAVFTKEVIFKTLNLKGLYGVF